MTEPSAMPTGRQLDAEVAAKLMGLNVVAMDWPCGYDPDDGSYGAAMDRDASYWHDETGPVFELSKHFWPVPVPFYSSDFVDAWQVVEHIRQQQFAIQDKFMRALRNQPHDIGEATKDIDTLLMDPFWWFMLHANIPEAICNAALKAVEGE